MTSGRATDNLVFMITLPLERPDRPAGRHRATAPTGLRANSWWTLAGVCIGVIMVGLDASVVAIANPRIALDPHASLADLQWITDAYMLTGLHSAMVVASAAAGIGALLALFATGGRDADAV